VIGLKKQGKCVGVIRGHDGEEDIDVVMPGAIFKNLIRKVSKAVGTCYVRIEGKEIHCAIQDIKVHAEMFV
jgi:ribosomal protein L25 (general stress protein Ctc)